MAVVSSCPDLQTLRDFTLGLVPEPEADVLEQHLAECESCLDRVTHLESQDTLVDAMRAQGSVPEKLQETWLINDLIAQAKRWVAGKEAERAGRAPGDTLAELQDFLAPATAPDHLGRLGRYEIKKVLGSGGMGVVFQAEDPRLKRQVAIKALKPCLAASATARKRFLREAQATAAIVHDGIISIHEVGEERGIPFLVMPLLQGESLDSRLKRLGKLPLGDVLRIGHEIADALAAAHRLGMIHRDIKPANIWLETTPPHCPPLAEEGEEMPSAGEQGSSQEEARTAWVAGAETSTPRSPLPEHCGRVKILDFGLAHVIGDESHPSGTGSVAGTPEYMAPEQARGEATDHRCDLFSLGSVLYSMCAGQAPFRGDSTMAVLWAVWHESPPPLRELTPDTPDWLEALVEKLHAKNPADRFQSAQELADLLKDYLEHLEHGGSTPPLVRPILDNVDFVPRHPGTGPAPKRSRRLLAAAAAFALAIAGLSLTEATGITGVGRWLGFGLEQQAGTPEKIYPIAVFRFEELGVEVKDHGARVTDLFFSALASSPDLYLVDRLELKKTLDEHALNLSGIVRPAHSIKVGQLTGAKILVTGSVTALDNEIHLMAKIISTETSQTSGVSEKGKLTDELAPMVEKLAGKVADLIRKQPEKFVAATPPKVDRIAALNNKFKAAKRPVISVQITEKHLGQPAADPAAQTELMLFCKETGFKIIDVEEGRKGQVGVLITGEAFSELATRHGNLVSVKARIDIKAVDRQSGEVVAADGQTSVAVDLSEHIAAKAALQEAAALVAERLLPKLVKEQP